MKEKHTLGAGPGRVVPCAPMHRQVGRHAPQQVRHASYRGAHARVTAGACYHPVQVLASLLACCGACVHRQGDKAGQCAADCCGAGVHGEETDERSGSFISRQAVAGEITHGMVTHVAFLLPCSCHYHTSAQGNDYFDRKPCKLNKPPSQSRWLRVLRYK